jgi:Tfp pilus assembly major pilin PilA
MNSKKNDGFSLLEIIIYIAVIAIVTAAISSVFLSMAGGQASANAVAEIDSNLTFPMNEINQDIVAASAVTTPAAAGATSSTLTLTVGATTVTYCVVSGQLYRGTGGICNSGSEPFTSPLVKVNNLKFTRLENTNSILPKTIVSIQTILSLSYNSANPRSQYTIVKQTTFSLR